MSTEMINETQDTASPTHDTAKAKYRYTTLLLMASIIFIYGVLYICFGELLSENRGAGWDGISKVHAAENFAEAIKSYDEYHVQRFGPSAIIHFSMRALHIPLEHENIIMAFSIYQLLLLVLVSVIWNLLAEEFRISAQGKWLGFVGLFLNYANLKVVYFYPPLTDTSALAESMLMLYFYMRHKPIALLVVTIISSFTWPTLLFFGLLLFIFPRQDSESKPARFNLHIIASSILACLLLVEIIFNYYLVIPKDYTSSIWRMTGAYGGTNFKVYVPLVNLAVITSVIYLFFAAKPLLNWDAFYIIAILKQMHRGRLFFRLFLSTLIFVCIKSTISYIAIGPGFLNTVEQLRRIAISSIYLPFIFGVAHVVYFGPVMILTYLLWKPISVKIQEFGPGMVLYGLAAVLMSLLSESRGLITFLPFVVLFTVLAAEKLKLTSFNIGFIALLGVIGSKFWLPVGEKLYRYLGNSGPWMSNKWYVFHGFGVIALGLLFYLSFFHKKNVFHHVILYIKDFVASYQIKTK